MTPDVNVLVAASRSDHPHHAVARGWPVQPILGPEWPQLRKLCEDEALGSNDVPEAWLAAAAIHQGEHVVSFDADFRRLLPRGRFTRLTA